jgi:hypothetical protein
MDGFEPAGKSLEFSQGIEIAANIGYPHAVAANEEIAPRRRIPLNEQYTHPLIQRLAFKALWSEPRV